MHQLRSTDQNGASFVSFYLASLDYCGVFFVCYNQQVDSFLDEFCLC